VKPKAKTTKKKKTEE